MIYYYNIKRPVVEIPHTKIKITHFFVSAQNNVPCTVKKPDQG